MSTVLLYLHTSTARSGISQRQWGTARPTAAAAAAAATGLCAAAVFPAQRVCWACRCCQLAAGDRHALACTQPLRHALIPLTSQAAAWRCYAAFRCTLSSTAGTTESLLGVVASCCSLDTCFVAGAALPALPAEASSWPPATHMLNTMLAPYQPAKSPPRRSMLPAPLSSGAEPAQENTRMLSALPGGVLEGCRHWVAKCGRMFLQLLFVLYMKALCAIHRTTDCHMRQHSRRYIGILYPPCGAEDAADLDFTLCRCSGK